MTKEIFHLKVEITRKGEKNLQLSLPKVLTLDGFPKALGKFLPKTDAVVPAPNNTHSSH